jgi:ATP-dependent Lon protease
LKLENYDEFPAKLPIIKEENIIYPFMIIPVFLESNQDIDTVSKALNEHSLIMITSNDKLDGVGTIGSIVRKVNLPDGRVKILFQGLAKGVVISEIEDFNALVDIFKENIFEEKNVIALLDTLKDSALKLSNVLPSFPKEILQVIDDNNDPSRTIDLIASSLKLKNESAYELFIEKDIEKRIISLISILNEEIEKSKLKNELSKKAQKQINTANREYFLKQQLSMIKKELGEDKDDNSEEIEEYYKKLKNLEPKISKEVHKEIKKQIDRLSRLHPESGDASIIQNYLDWALEIPFGKESKKKLSLNTLEKSLDDDHYSLKKPKERILEYFAVKELTELRGKEFNGAIICFVGAPGVGKTSLANSIAKSLKRELVRIALGGIEDVSELRGHRRTYIGAMPGRIIQGLISAKSINPVIVLDEIDKVARHRGDPTSVLLEILDPEQNSHFRDLYLNFEMDLSKVLFIATANDISQVPAPLRDRLELIFVDSYTPQEKFEIAKKYLIPQEMKKHSLKKTEVSISEGAIKELIDKYTREAGVRNLRKQIAKIMRKAALSILQENKKLNISIKNINKYLDKGLMGIDTVPKENRIGVVNGLAWTAVGGDVLTIETIKFKGKGGIALTGKLGEVMKESAKIALSVVKNLIDIKTFNIPQIDEKEVYDSYSIHLHVPEGATPKDGPSAGITMATAIASIFSNKDVRSDVAMTGELTLSGDVLPIGGLKEKLIAAHKAKIKKALIPYKNYERDLEDIPDEVKDAIEIIPVKKIEEVLEHSLVN